MSELRVIYATGLEGSKASPALLGQAMAALSCLSCGLALAPVYEYKGRTALRFGRAHFGESPERRTDAGEPVAPGDLEKGRHRFHGTQLRQRFGSSPNVPPGY